MPFRSGGVRFAHDTQPFADSECGHGKSGLGFVFGWRGSPAARRLPRTPASVMSSTRRSRTCIGSSTRPGTLARLGHNHTIAAGDLTGNVAVDDGRPRRVAVRARVLGGEARRRRSDAAQHAQAPISPACRRPTTLPARAEHVERQGARRREAPEHPHRRHRPDDARRQASSWPSRSSCSAARSI